MMMHAKMDGKIYQYTVNASFIGHALIPLGNILQKKMAISNKCYSYRTFYLIKK